MNNQTGISEHLDERNFASCWRMLILAVPLIFSQMGIMVMQIVDGIFLARYSESAIAAVGPAGMSFWLVCGFFIGIVGYTATFVAQNMGARRPGRVGSVVWQGVYLALFSGCVLTLCVFSADWIFRVAGHDPAIREQEVIYFKTLCMGGLAFTLSGAVSGFFAGRNDNVSLMFAHLAGGVTNAVLDPLLIFGLLGFPEMGMAGAAWATVIGHVVQVAILGALFFKSRFLTEFNTWSGRGMDLSLMSRMIHYGFPNGIRFVIEIAAGTVFLMVIGRSDPEGLAASNIAWRINGMAFFPVIGLSIVVSMLVGQAQGARRPDLSRRATGRGLIMGQIWMASAALLMVLFPDILLRLFLGTASVDGHVPIYVMSVKLLRFVAAYCLVDNFNIILMAMLAGAGDTRWMLFVSGALHLGFILALVLMALFGADTIGFWYAITAFIFIVACFWSVRFRSRRWESMRVIETHPLDVITPAFSGPNISES